MEVKQKVILTLFLVLAFVFHKLSGSLISKSLKNRLQVKSPELVKSTGWFFRIDKILIPVWGILTFILIVFIWLK